jgi:predicted CXXCH cytochrome family protein
MNRRVLPTWGLLVAFVTVGIALACRDVAAEDTCTSAQCHAKLLTGSTVHPIAESCETCHESTGTPHPKKGQKTFKLTKEPPDLCFGCHEAFGTKSKVVHYPVTAGQCTTCHDPHSSNEPKLLAQPMKDLCGTCHSDHVSFKVVHGPVSAGTCTACHTPHEGDNKARLEKEPPELCFGCHADMQDVTKKANVHPALAAGCPSCHNPHGSDFPKLLSAEGQDLCFTCHPQIQEIVSAASVPHPALSFGEGCVSCHSPHASDNPNMLLKTETETCLGCHDTIITKAMTALHTPIKNGKCTGCHMPHGSQNATLLVKPFPTDAYVPYSDNEYALCFSCHKRDLLAYPQTSYATNFRDGERNLHYLHVNKPKGRSCRLCHNIHGSSQPKLIAESVPFGKWNLPLKFVKTETGGGCSPGCHKPQYYDRNTPGKKPEGTKRAVEAP